MCDVMNVIPQEIVEEIANIALYDGMLSVRGTAISVLSLFACSYDGLRLFVILR